MKKPKLKKDILPDTDILNEFSSVILTLKLVTLLVTVFGVVTAVNYLFDGKTWDGYAFLNKRYDYEVTPANWAWVIWIKSLFGG